MSDQIGPNELPFHFHGPSHHTTQDKMASILSPELSSPKGRWVDPVHQVDPEDSEEASTRRWPSGCSRQTQEAPSCPEFPEFFWAALQTGTAAPLPCPAWLLCSHPMFSPDRLAHLLSLGGVAFCAMPSSPWGPWNRSTRGCSLLD